MEVKKPVYLPRYIECKLKDKGVSKSLLYLKRKFPDVKATQALLSNNIDLKTKDGIRICSAHLFLSEFV